MNETSKELTLDELRVILSKPLSPKFTKKAIKKGLRMDIGKYNATGELYPNKVMNLGLDMMREALGRKPTEGEIEKIIILWREYNAQTATE